MTPLPVPGPRVSLCSASGVFFACLGSSVAEARTHMEVPNGVFFPCPWNAVQASRKYVQDLEESVSALKVQLQQAAEERVRMNEQTEQQVADLQAEVQLVRQQGILSVQHLQECVQEKEAELKRQREEADQSFQEMLTRLEGEKTEALSQLQQQMEVGFGLSHVISECDGSLFQQNHPVVGSSLPSPPLTLVDGGGC